MLQQNTPLPFPRVQANANAAADDKLGPLSGLFVGLNHSVALNGTFFCPPTKREQQTEKGIAAALHCKANRFDSLSSQERGICWFGVVTAADSLPRAIVRTASALRHLKTMYPSQRLCLALVLTTASLPQVRHIDDISFTCISAFPLLFHNLIVFC